VRVQVRAPWNNPTQTDIDLTPSGSTKPLNPLIALQYSSNHLPPHTHTHTHTDAFLHYFEEPLGKLSALIRFPFPFFAYPSNILHLDNLAVIAGVGSSLSAPTVIQKDL